MIDEQEFLFLFVPKKILSSLTPRFLQVDVFGAVVEKGPLVDYEGYEYQSFKLTIEQDKRVFDLASLPEEFADWLSVFSNNAGGERLNPVAAVSSRKPARPSVINAAGKGGDNVVCDGADAPEEDGELLKEGFLKKQGGLRKNWKDRFFRLHQTSAS